MKRQIIRLTEQDLKRIIIETLEKLEWSNSEPKHEYRKDMEDSFPYDERGRFQSNNTVEEQRLRSIIRESINKVLMEDGQFIDDKRLGRIYVPNREVDAMEKAFTNKTKGQELLDAGVKVLKGKIDPDRYYRKAFYVNRNTSLYDDAIVQYPDGKTCSLNIVGVPFHVKDYKGAY